MRIPQRILETTSPLGKVEEGFIREMLTKYAENL